MRSNSLLAGGILLLSLGIGGLSVLAQSTPGETPATSSSSSPSPGAAATASPINTVKGTVALNFLHHMNMGEIIDANDALTMLTSQQAIQFAQSMINDHQQAEQAVTTLANQNNFSLYNYQPSTFEVAASDQLAMLSGTDFDLGYLQLQLTDHQKALQDLNFILAQTTDPGIQSLLNQAKTMVQNHIDLANTTISGFNSAGTASPTPSTSPSTQVSPSSSPSMTS